MLKNIYYIFWVLIKLLVFTTPVVAQSPFSSLSNQKIKPQVQKMSLVDVLDELKNRRHVSFLYEPEIVQGIYVLDKFNYEDKIPTILKRILPPLGLTYKKVGKRNFVIKQIHKSAKLSRGEAIPAVSPVRQKQQVLIEGTLLSQEDGSPLIGATIRVEGGNLGTISDAKGNFQLGVPLGKQQLRISYFGFKPKVIEVNKKEHKTILLEPSTTQMDEVVIVSVGLEAKKRKLGYAMDVLEAKDLLQSQESNPISALASKSSGVWVTSASGSPGASAGIVIRGYKSITGKNKPLIILDGMPIDNTTTGNGTGGVDVSNRLIDIDLRDIESISILKGPAGAALYGIRAANGAIILNSKKGQIGKTQVRYSTSIGLDEVSQLPERQSRYAQGIFYQGKPFYKGPESSASTSYGPELSELEFDGNPDYPYDNGGTLVPVGQGNGNPAKAYDPYEAFFIKGFKHQHHLSVSGGSDKLTYYISSGFLRQDGVVPNSSFQRNTLKSLFEIRPHRNLSVGISTDLAYSQGNRMKRGSMFSGVPLGLFRNPISFDIGNGLQGRKASDNPASYMFESGKQRAYRGSGRYDNPFWTVNRNPFKDKVYRLIQNLSITYQLKPWLSLSSRIGFDFYTDQRLDAFDIHSGTHPNGRINETDIQSRKLNSDVLLVAEKNISSNWAWKGTLGHNYYASGFTIKEFRGDELKTQGLYTLNNAITISSNEAKLDKQLQGVFTDMMFSYQDYLHINFSMRNDWSSTLAKGNRSFLYPSTSIAWELSEHFKFTGHPVFSYVKLKASASQVGNDAASYLTDTYFDFAVSDGDDLLPGLIFPAFGINAFERSTVLGNPNLKAETANSFEFGTEMWLLNGVIHLDINAYTSANKHQIVRTQLSAATGFLRAPRNSGTIRNKGLEIDVLLQPKLSGKLQWETDLGFTIFRSKVSDLTETMPQITMASFTALSSNILNGHPYGVFIGNSKKRDEEGRVIIGEDGFPLLNDEHTIIGDPNPDFLASIRNSLTFKEIKFSFLWDIRKGGDIWNGTRGVMSYLGVSKESGDLREVRDYIFPGVLENGEINTKPVAFADPEGKMSSIFWRRYGFLGLSEDNVEDGSWIRLREISLSYKMLVPSWLNKENSHITMSLSGRNLLLFTRYTGIDPETNLRGDSNIIGWDYFNLPNTRGWSLNLEYDF